jgi:hypothetical protein
VFANGIDVVVEVPCAIYYVVVTSCPNKLNELDTDEATVTTSVAAIVIPNVAAKVSLAGSDTFL